MQHFFADEEALSVEVEEFLLGGLNFLEQEWLLLFDLADILQQLQFLLPHITIINLMLIRIPYS